jgi:hypothetical protein
VDAQLFAQGGRYLAGDHGSSLGFNSQFRERSYEFAYTKTDLGKLLTFTLRWPLGQREYSRPSSLRFRQERNFRVAFSQKPGEIGRTFLSDTYAENWQIAMLPSALPRYLAFFRDDPSGGDPKVMEGVKDVPSSERIGPSLSGSAGLWFVPAAAVEPYGYWTLGANWLDRKYRLKEGSFSGSGTTAEYFTFGPLPHLEITLRLTNQEGKLGVQRYRFNPATHPITGSGWDVDKEVSLQYLLWEEKGRRPAFALGAQDFAGDVGKISSSVIYKAYYGVLSKHFGGLGVHAGVGTDTLHGPFVGADYLLTPKVRLIADYARDETTIQTHKATAGVRAELLKNVRLDVYAPNLKSFGVGATWTRRM